MEKPASTLWTGVVVLAVAILAAFLYAYSMHQPPAFVMPGGESVSYSCGGQKGIAAAYASSTVALALSDGRSINLPQVPSGSGIRYEGTAEDGSDITFVSKGDNAFLEENGSVTYSDCLAGTSAASASGTLFTDAGKTFSFEYAPPITVSGGGVGYSTDWMVNATASGLVLAVATLPDSFEPSTNFRGAKLTVGTSADPSAVATCLTYEPTGGPAATTTTSLINGTSYRVLHTSDAGAGNFYETTSYRTVRDNQCYAIEYTIHTTNIGNYSPDQGITAYDQAKVTHLLGDVVQSFRFLAPGS
ncbi:MAG: MliC family protein [bacterium]